MQNELEQLKKQRAEIDQKIRLLTDGTAIHENVKLDFIATKGPQRGRFAVSYKYRYVGWFGRERTHRDCVKWVPLFSRATRKEAINTIPEVVKDLLELYNELREGVEDNDEE